MFNKSIDRSGMAGNMYGVRAGDIAVPTCMEKHVLVARDCTRADMWAAAHWLLQAAQVRFAVQDPALMHPSIGPQQILHDISRLPLVCHVEHGMPIDICCGD